MLKHTKIFIGAFALITAFCVSGVHNTAQANDVELKMWGGFRDKVVAGGTIVAAEPVTYNAPVNSNTYVILAHDPFHWHPFYIYHRRPHRPRWHSLPPPRPHNPGHRPQVHRPPKPNRPASVHRPMPKPRPHVKPAPRPQSREEIYQSIPDRPHGGHRPSGGRHHGGARR